MRVIVVGINSMDSLPGKNHTLVRLARWMPVQHYSFINVIPDVVGPVYSPRQTRRDWVDNALSAGYDRVISLGPLPSAVLTRMGVEHYVLPHPSGRNRLLNDQSFEAEMVRRLELYLLQGALPVRHDKSVIGTVQGGPDSRVQPRKHRPADWRRVAWLRARVRHAA